MPVSEYGIPRNTFEQYNTDHDRTRADLLTTRFTWTLSPHLTLSSDTRARELRPVFPVHERRFLPRQRGHQADLRPTP